MSYVGLINANIEKAFVLLKDLVKSASLITQATSDFDFTTGEAEMSKAIPSTVEVIMIEEKKKSKTSEKYILLKKMDVAQDLTIYDSIIIDNAKWRLGEVVNNSAGFILLIKVYKEA
jgi:hypothetical protein